MSLPSAASRSAAVLLAALVAALLMLATQAPPAAADNCQVEELVTKTVFPSDHPLYNSPIPDSSDPRCIVLKSLGCDNAATPGPCVKGILVRNDVCVIDPAYPDYPRTFICTSELFPG